MGRNLVPGSVSGTGSPEIGFRTRGIVPGSEGCEPEVSKVSVFDGFPRVRFCSRGLDGTGSGNRVPGTPSSGPRFRKLLCTSKVYSCTLKSIFLYFEVVTKPFGV